MRESESGARVQILQDDDLLERDNHPKGEKQNGLTESENHCTIVLLYKDICPATFSHNFWALALTEY